MNKVQLILIDGMRPDALAKCSNPYINELLSKSLYTLKARTVMPSVTLPCHMSLFHSTDPTRHNITTNHFTPQVRPIAGIFEQLGRKYSTGMFYNWEELRDLARPGNLGTAACYPLAFYGYEKSNRLVTDHTISFIKEYSPDFVFTYLGWCDGEGHDSGWMSDNYLHSIDKSFDCIKEIIEAQSDDCITIILADHGGHDRDHGRDIDEDMLIPVIIHGKDIPAGVIPGDVSIKDIAPTITKLLGAKNAPEWEGTSIL